MSLQGMLKRRDLKVFATNQREHLIFPENFSMRSQDKFYQLLSSYGFRTLLKDLILHKDDFSLSDLTRYCSEKMAKSYLRDLEDLKLIKKQGKKTYCLVKKGEIFSLGETLEWYLARLLEKELECDSRWNVVLKGLPSGGDYDVLADCENHLLYIEAKSGPPKSVEIDNIRAYLRRIKDLRPDFTIFFEDTTLRMKDKILPIFEEQLGRTFERIHDETFRHGGYFITNSKPEILENIRLCISTYLTDRALHSPANSPT